MQSGKSKNKNISVKRKQGKQKFFFIFCLYLNLCCILFSHTAISQNKETTVLKVHNKAVNSVAFSPDGKYIASAADDKSIRLWSIEKKRNI